MTAARDSGRTLLVAHPSADLYGSDRVLLESVTALAAAGWEVVVTLPGDGPLVPHLRDRGVAVELCPAPVLRKSILRPAGLLGFAVQSVRGAVGGLRLLRRTRADAVYVNTVTVPLWVVLARARGLPVLCHVHEAEGSASPWVRRLLALPLVLATRVVVNSRFSQDTLLASAPVLRRRTSVVDNAVLGPAEPVAARPRLQEPVRLLYVGRLSPRKGVDLALEAVDLLTARGVRVQLDVVGGVFPGYEWYQEQLDARVATVAGGGGVVLHGFSTDVWSHVRRADVVLVPSRVDEPFGNTAVEAVLAGRPVVVSCTSGLLEAAGGYGCVRFVEPDDAAALADGVQDVIDHWAAYRGATERDAAAAAVRHSPARYGSVVASVVADLVEDRP